MTPLDTQLLLNYLSEYKLYQNKQCATHSPSSKGVPSGLFRGKKFTMRSDYVKYKELVISRRQIFRPTLFGAPHSPETWETGLPRYNITALQTNIKLGPK